MSDPTSTEPTEGQGQTPAQLREFADRQRADAEAARTEAEQLRADNRRLTFAAAGVDLDSPTGKLLDKAYDGDLTVDAVKSAWAEVAPTGAAPTPEPEPVDDGPTAEEQAAAAARNALVTGGNPPGEEPTGPVWENALAGYREGAAQGIPEKTRQRNALNQVFTAAAQGDQSVIFDEEAWKARAREG